MPNTLPPDPADICPHGDLLDSFTASFDGWCFECNTGIVAGRRICAMSDGTYRHLECAP